MDNGRCYLGRKWSGKRIIILIKEYIVMRIDDIIVYVVESD